MRKKLVALLAAVLVLLSASACHMVYVDQEKDYAQVVFSVNGKEYTKGDIMKLYEAYRNSYGLTDENQETDAYIDNYHQVLDQIYTELLEHELILQYGSEIGITELTDEQMEGVYSDLAQMEEMLENSVRTTVEDEAENDPTIDIEAEVARQLEERRAYYGLSTGEYQERIEKEALRSAVRKYLEENYVPSEEDVQSFYDTNLADQKRLLEEDMGNFSVFARSNLTMYIPEGLRYVHSILIAIPTDARSEILRLRAGSEEDQQKAQQLLDEELAKIEARAQECYARLQAGEDFEKLLDEYGDDPGMKKDALNRESGYILYKEDESYDKDFMQAAFALEKAGDVSPLTPSAFGYYIIRMDGETEEKTLSLEECRENIQAYIKNEMAQNAYGDKIQQWKRQADIVEYKDRLY
ncbi:MAG: peptidyl-prolyl cis-trans isomerase [Clostridiales bacterium]|nr:peptidyl-prolyl cis-trans isomerase [Clostridiales bacterium]